MAADKEPDQTEHVEEAENETEVTVRSGAKTLSKNQQKKLRRKEQQLKFRAEKRLENL